MPAFKMDHHLLVVNQVSLLGLAPSLDAMGVGRKLLWRSCDVQRSTSEGPSSQLTLITRESFKIPRFAVCGHRRVSYEGRQFAAFTG